jgi:type IV pilus assembly protein PilV
MRGHLSRTKKIRRRMARARERGSFLLEALISVLIVAFAILGSIGLLARSMQNVDDAKFRGEAAYLANQLIGNMWLANRQTANLIATFDSGSGGAGFVEFQTMVEQRLPNANLLTQEVTVTAGPTATSSNVVVTIRWKGPGEPGLINDANAHKYETAATVGANQ